MGEGRRLADPPGGGPEAGYGRLVRDYFQAAWVVDDLDAAVAGWLAAGVGPFYRLPGTRGVEVVRHGEVVPLDTSVVWAQAGALQVELVQQHDDRPSAYRDSVPAGQDAPHHLGALTDDLDGELERHRAAGLGVPYESALGGVRVAYLDTRPTTGLMTELVQRNPLFNGLRALVAQAAVGWDGADPVRDVPG